MPWNVWRPHDGVSRTRAADFQQQGLRGKLAAISVVCNDLAAQSAALNRAYMRVLLIEDRSIPFVEQNRAQPDRWRSVAMFRLAP